MVGASAGGVQALQLLLPSLSPKLPAVVAVAIHRLPTLHGDRLPRVLARTSLLPVRGVTDGEAMRPGSVYIAPPGMQMEIVDGLFRLNASENGAQPSIDALFRTAAEVRGRKVVGILLSGLLDDGTAGLAAIKAAGGFTIVQEPAEALFGDMPRNAIANVPVDVVCRVGEMHKHVEPAAAYRATLMPKPESADDHARA